jgi:hypothetical protein
MLSATVRVLVGPNVATEGELVGSDVGLAVADVFGPEVGAGEGELVGSRVGALVGAAVGKPVGEVFGASLGAEVSRAKMLSATVGVLVGPDVAAEGELVGSDVRLAVADAVGPEVGGSERELVGSRVGLLAGTAVGKPVGEVFGASLGAEVSRTAMLSAAVGVLVGTSGCRRDVGIRALAVVVGDTVGSVV